MPTPFLSTDPPEKRAPAKLPWIMTGLSTVVLLSSMATSIANVALPTFMSAFGASFQTIQWIVLAYLLAMTALVVGAGRLGDLFGRRRLMLAGIGIFTLASVGCGAAQDLWVLIAARAAQGTGAAIMMALALALVGDSVPRERTGSAMGFLGTMSAVGTALGPSLGGLLISALGWQAIFFANVPLGVIAFGLTYGHLPTDPVNTRRPSFDYRGSALLVLTLAAYALSMTLGHGAFGVVNAVLFGISVAGAGLLLFVEAESPHPLLRPALFRDPVVGSSFVMSGLVTTVVMTTLVVGPFHLAGALRLEIDAVGLAMSTGPVIAALAGMPAGRAVDRFGPHRMAVAGLLAMTAGCAALAVVPVTYGVVGYLVPLATVTAGFAIFQAANNTAVLTGIEVSQRGVISGLIGLSRNLGLITGASLMGAVFSLAVGTHRAWQESTDAVAFGTHAAFTVATVLIAAALWIALRAWRRVRMQEFTSPSACTP